MESGLGCVNGLSGGLVMKQLRENNDANTLPRIGNDDNGDSANMECVVKRAVDSNQRILDCQTMFGKIDICQENDFGARLKVDAHVARRKSAEIPADHDETLDIVPPMRQKSNSVPDTKALLAKRVERTKPKPLHRRDTPMDFSWTQSKSKVTSAQRSLSHNETEEDEWNDQTRQTPEADDTATCQTNGADDSETDRANTKLNAAQKRQNLKRQDTPACGNVQKPVKAQLTSCGALDEADEREEIDLT